MRCYEGLATGTVVGPKVVHVNGKPLQHINKHSPSGFNWGYGGSGPADLAYAILYDMYGKDVAQEYYQRFKWDKIATLPQGKEWQLWSDEIEAWKKEVS